jgi:predicted metal-dependent hydrolase
MAAGATEESRTIELPDGPLDYTLRRSRRARRLRITVDPRRGVIATIPAGRPGAREAAAQLEPFLRERAAWLRRHLDRQAHDREAIAGPDGLGGLLARADRLDGAVLRLEGEPHVIEVEAPTADLRRSEVIVAGGRRLLVRPATRDRRPLASVVESYLRERAAHAIDGAIARHAQALGVQPAAIALRDPRSRWGSAARTGRLAFSWRLILAPPEALETTVVHELAHLRVFGHGPAFWAVVATRVPDHRAHRRWLRAHSTELHATLGPAADT